MSIRTAICSSARPTICTPTFKEAYADLGEWRSDCQLPVVYHPRYNIRFGGIEKFHPFDSCKFQKIVNMLTQRGYMTKGHIVEPRMATHEVLADVHTDDYIKSIQSSSRKVASVVSLPPVALLPSLLVRRLLVEPMKHHVAGTMLATALAIETGWAVNLGGGMHHAHRFDGDGWCPFDDIMLAIRRIRSASNGQVQRVMIIDVDAHQGNGVERDKLHFNDNDLFILDVYNGQIYPMDEAAKAGIDIKVELRSGTKDAAYLSKLADALQKAADSGFQPDLIIYNAGTDPYEHDPLGRLGLSSEGVKERDALVWQFAVARLQVPICMVLSGGYAADSARVISDSLAALFDRYGLGKGGVVGGS